MHDFDVLQIPLEYTPVPAHVLLLTTVTIDVAVYHLGISTAPS